MKNLINLLHSIFSINGIFLITMAVWYILAETPDNAEDVTFALGYAFAFAVECAVFLRRNDVENS